VAGFPLAVSVQKTFARAWRVPMLGWMASYLRGGLWFLLYVATQTGVEAATWTLGRNLGFGVLAGLAGVVLTFLLWLATPPSAARQGPGGLARPGPHRDRRHRVTVGLRLLGFRSRWAPGRWWCASVAPAGWSASSCVGCWWRRP
jgi:hypothetical protein